MKKILALCALAIVTFSSCLKDDKSCNYVDSNIVASPAEVAALQDSLAKYNINAIQHPSGFFYSIVNPGNGNAVANLCTSITAEYQAEFFEGQVIDSTATGKTATFLLGEVIPGWQKGISLVKGGGDINLYIPPSLGYGSQNVTDPNTGEVVIPRNSYLVFEVHVSSIQ